MKTDNGLVPELNRVLLPYYGFFKKYDFHGREGAFRDVTSFQFIVEALVAQSASQIAFDSWGEDVDEALLESVPETLKKRIIFVDRDGSAIKPAISVFSPIFDEFSLEGDRSSLTFKRSLGDDELARAIGVTFFSLQTFILGLRNKLQVDIDLESLRKSVSIIRSRSRNPESRANMAILEGIFNCYKQETVGAIQIVPHGEKRQTELFVNFLEDVTFEELSRATYGFGFPLLFRKSAMRVRQIIRQMMSSEKFAPIVSACSKPLVNATGIPIPTTELIKIFEFSDYLPPIISLEPTLKQAYESWNALLKDDNLAERYEKSRLEREKPPKISNNL